LNWIDKTDPMALETDNDDVVAMFLKDERVCTWSQDSYETEYNVWNTDCARVFQLSEGTPADNGMRFCCYCGRKIIEKKLNLERK